MSKADLIVAETIMQQLGTTTLLLIGAKKPLAMSSTDTHRGGLSLKIGQNAKRVTHVEIGLNGNDLYDVRFLNCSTRRKKDPIRLESEWADVDVSMLHNLIETETGLYTRF